MANVKNNRQNSYYQAMNHIRLARNEYNKSEVFDSAVQRAAGLGKNIRSLTGFLLSSLFENNEKGVLFDPSVAGTLYQTTAMQIPARPADPVGMMLDQSQWGDTALGDLYGPELVSDAGFDTPAYWTLSANTSVSGGAGRFIPPTVNGDNIRTAAMPIEAGKMYVVQYTVKNYIAGSVRSESVGGANPAIGTQRAANGSYTDFLTVGAVDSAFRFRTTDTATNLEIDNVSIREVTVANALDPIMGPELVTNGGFDTATGWVQDPSWTISGGVATSNSASGYDGVYYTLGQLSAGKIYKVTIEIKSVTSGGVNVYPADSGNGPSLTASTVGVHTVYLERVATASFNGVTIRAANGFVGSIDNVSIREVTGNHATQATAAKRPTYGIHPKGGTRNLLTYTEDFSNAAWLKTGSTPATVSGKTVTLPVTGAGIESQDVTPVGGTASKTFTVSAILSGSGTVNLKNTHQGVMDNYGPNITLNATPTLHTFTVTNGPSAGGGKQIFGIRSTSGAATVVVDAIQGETGPTATDYQKVVSKYEVTETTYTQRRNLLTYTEDFSNAVWTKQNLTVAGKTLTPTATNTSHNLIYSASGLNGSGVYTASGRASAAGYDYLLIRIDNGAGDGVKVSFNIATGAVSNAAAPAGTGWTMLGAGITPSPDGGFDFYISFTLSASATGIRLIPYVSNVAADAFAAPAFLGDGASGIILHETQLEKGPTATDYQRIEAAFVSELISTVPSVHYLSFDGADDKIVANTTNPATVDMTYAIAYDSPATGGGVSLMLTSPALDSVGFGGTFDVRYDGNWQFIGTKPSPNVPHVLLIKGKNGLHQTYADEVLLHSSTPATTSKARSEINLFGNSIAGKLYGFVAVQKFSDEDEDQSINKILRSRMGIADKTGETL